MKILFSHITRKKRGGIATRNEYAEADTITIGRSTSCELSLLDPRVHLEHAKVIKKLDTYEVVAAENTLLEVNGELVDKTTLKTGDTFLVGPYKIIFESPSSDVDLKLSIELTKNLRSQVSDLISRSNIDASNFGISKRTWSWSLFSIITALFLITPLLVINSSTENLSSLDPEDLKISSTDLLSVWSTGEISSPHNFFAHDCEVCHEKPFVPVQNNSCTKCHDDIQHHADAKLFPSASLSDLSCQSCHKEHQGKITVVKNNQDFCASCHESIQDESNSLLRNASDFGKNHPQFNPTVIIDKDKNTNRSLSIGGDPKPIEFSGLLFNHAVHLRETGVRHPNDGIIDLECKDCHVSDSGGVSMLPISFKEHCNSCHKLYFDSSLPNRELYHGNTDELFIQIENVYNSIAFQGGYAGKDAPNIIRRRAGQMLNKTERIEAAEWAKRKKDQVLEGQFGKDRCAVCHIIQDNEQRWTIQSVNITDTWFPKASFTHESHEDMDCTSCHEASKSKQSMDVIQPSIEICQSCHGGENAKTKIPSTCISCHGFHFEHMSPIYPINEVKAREGTILSSLSEKNLTLLFNKRENNEIP